jgi:short-subunit dehydrogenase
METTSFKNQVVIVTGASSGIGKALCMQLAQEGACLALAARDAERLDRLAEECHLMGGSAIAAPTDVAEEGQCRELIEKTVSQFGRIDMLVNNAGFSLAGKFDELPNLDLFKKVMEVNFTGMVQCTYYALPCLKDTHGRIVNVSSLGGKFAVPYNTSYVASKFAVTGFSDSLRMELKRSDVSVTVIFPFWVVTEFHERLLDKDGRPRGKEGRAAYTSNMMTADECAARILRAARLRKREVLMWPGPISGWLKLIAPNLLDKIIVERIFRPVAERSVKKEALNGR